MICTVHTYRNLLLLHIRMFYKHIWVDVYKRQVLVNIKWYSNCFLYVYSVGGESRWIIGFIDMKRVAQINFVYKLYICGLHWKNNVVYNITKCLLWQSWVKRMDAERNLLYLYLGCIVSGATTASSLGIAWAYWTRTLNTCVDVNCGCIPVSYTHLDVYKRQ